MEKRPLLDLHQTSQAGPIDPPIALQYSFCHRETSYATLDPPDRWVPNHCQCSQHVETVGHKPPSQLSSQFQRFLIHTVGFCLSGKFGHSWTCISAGPKAEIRMPHTPPSLGSYAGSYAGGFGKYWKYIHKVVRLKLDIIGPAGRTGSFHLPAWWVSPLSHKKTSLLKHT